MRETRHQIGRRFLVVGLCASFGGFCMSSSTSAMTGQKVRPVIALSCPQGASDPVQALCGALQQTLQQAVPHGLIRTGEDVAPMPGSLALRLVPTHETRHGLSAHLEWKTIQTEAWQTGPDVTLDSPDVALRAGMMTRLAAGLVRASDLPLPGTN